LAARALVLGKSRNRKLTTTLLLPALISGGVASKIGGLLMRVFGHKRNRAAAQRSLLGFDVYGLMKMPP
jgi:hypothetical protein